MLYYNVTYSIAIPTMYRLFIALLCLNPLVTHAQMSVVTSIRPLYQITAAIMQNVGEPELLIKTERSAHHFAFKPSHFKSLQQADLVIWIDRRFESGFRRLPKLLSGSTRQLELLPALGLQGQDGHIWYSPDQLLHISDMIAATLIEIDTTNQAMYEENRDKFHQEIRFWQKQISRFMADRQPKYLLDHDFLQYFHTEFNHAAIAVIHDNHDQFGGIKALKKIEMLLQEQPAKCLISNENNFSLVGINLAKQFDLSRQRLNYFTGEGPVATRFIRHLRHLAQVLERC